MADDRFWLWCEECKEELFVAKAHGSGWFFYGEDAEFSEKMMVFLDKHATPYCGHGKIKTKFESIMENDGLCCPDAEEYDRSDVVGGIQE